MRFSLWVRVSSLNCHLGVNANNWWATGTQKKYYLIQFHMKRRVLYNLLPRMVLTLNFSRLLSLSFAVSNCVINAYFTVLKQTREEIISWIDVNSSCRKHRNRQIAMNHTIINAIHLQNDDNHNEFRYRIGIIAAQADGVERCSTNSTLIEFICINWDVSN